MKTLRLLTLVFAAVLVISALGPAPVYARDSTSPVSVNVDVAKKVKTAQLRVNNRTGGSLYISLSGNMNYSFSTSSQGKTTFTNIQPGSYLVTVRASACGGALTYRRNFKKNVSLPRFVCRKK